MIHVSSGLSLGGLVETEEEAQRWLEAVKDLTDWTQDQQAIYSLGPDFAQQLQEVRNQVTGQTDEKLKRLLSPLAVKALEQEMVLSSLTLREIVEYAIDSYLLTMMKRIICGRLLHHCKVLRTFEVKILRKIN